MTIKEASKKWNVSSTIIKKLIISNHIKFDPDNIPNNIKGLIIVDRRSSRFSNLTYDQVTLVLLSFIYCHCFFNSYLLNIGDLEYQEYIDNLIDEKLVFKNDNVLFELTEKGKDLFLSQNNKNPKFIKMLLGSCKVNRLVIDRIEELL